MKPRRVLWRVFRAMLVVTALTVTGHSVAHDRELTDADFRVRVQAALRLGHSGPAARADLEDGLRDSHPAVRVACAAGLANIGDPGSIPTLERAVRSESSPMVKAALKETIEKLRSAKTAPAPISLADAKYVVQLGSMKNISGVRADDLDPIMRQAARAKAATIKGAYFVDGPDPSVVKRATERRIPVLQVDGSLTRLTQVRGTDGSTVISAKVDMSISKLPQHTLTATVSGNASGSHTSPHVSDQSLFELQNRVVGGAVESAMGSMGAGIAALAK